MRRQEIEFYKARAMIIATMMVEAKDKKPAADAYLEFFESIFPFAKGSHSNIDHKAREALQKEATKGPIFFKPTPSTFHSPLHSAARKMCLPDEFQRKILKNRKPSQ